MSTPPSLTTKTCPHCGAANPPVSAFCESCGKALPAANPTGPRIVSGTQFASTTVGQELQADALHKKAKKAAGALLAVAIIQTIVSGIIFLVAYNATKSRQMEVNYAVVAGMLIVATVFWGLWFWARKQPLPAAIVGLALYVTLVAVNVITSVNQMAHEGMEGQQRRGPFGGIGIGWLDIVIIAVLARAITAGAQHRKLLRQQASGQPM